MVRTGLTYENDDEPIPGYRLVARLGRGGAGEVWRAVAPGGINVALKVVNKLQEGGGRREMQGLQRIKNISHNHLCRIQGFWTKDKDGYVLDTSTAFPSEGSLTDTVTPSVEQGNAVQLIVAMELGDETLADAFERCNAGRLAEARVGIPLEDLFRYIEAAGLAVDHLNQKYHICHCDLKPQNILLVNGEAKVCDFGLARQVVDTKKTMAPAFTPQYGAPEMMVGAEYHPRMDQYSLALTYAELRTGRFPFPSFTRVTTESQLAVLAREKWDGKFDLSALPKAERKVIAKALSPVPDERYETIEEMLDALRVAIFPGNRNPRKPSPGKPSSGNRSWWFASTAVSCSLIVLVAVMISGSPSEILSGDPIKRFGEWWRPRPLDPPAETPKKPPSKNGGSPIKVPVPDKLDKILDPADKTLRKFKEGNDVRLLKDALAAIEQVLNQDRHHARAAELRKPCLEWYFRLADGQLERNAAAQVRPYLAVIEEHCQKFPQPAETDLYRARVDLYRARVYAAEGNWAQVQTALGQLRPGEKALSPEDRIQFLLLVTRLARNKDPNSLCSKDGLKNLSELKAAAAQLTAKEAEEVAEIDAFTKQQLHANWKNLPQTVKSAATEMWPNIEFELKLADTFQRMKSNGTDDLQEARRLLMELEPHLQLPSSTPQQRWEVSFLKVLLDLKQQENQASVTDVLPGLESLLTKPCAESLHKPGELFTALAGRFQLELEAKNRLDPDATLLGWDLWCKHADQEPDRTVDHRLRVLAIVARLSKDPTDYAAVRKDAEPLIASGSQFTVAAWAESVLAQGGPKAQEESQWQAAKKTINDDQPKAFYPDYVLFVRAWILDRLDGKTGAAADLLCPLASRASLSPPMQVVRRRTVAVGILARAIHALRDDKDTTNAEAFTPEDAKSAVKYLGLVDVLARELEPNDKDWPDLEENHILVLGISGDQPQKVVDLVQKLRARNKKLSLPVLRNAAHAERKLLELSPDSERENVRERALNAYAELLRSSRDAHDEFLDEARVIANLQSLEEKLTKWKTEELLPQLRNPGDELKAMLPASRLREPIALIYGLLGRRLRNTYDDSPAGLRNRLHAFAIAAWLASQPAKYLVELGETVRLLAELNSSTKFDTLKGLAQDASKSDPSYHGAYGLQAYVQLEQSRQATDVEKHRQLLDEGIAVFEQALHSQPPEADRAWYLVGLSTAYVERAILAGSEPGIVASCETTEVLTERRGYLTKARERAVEATNVVDPINPPEDAWIAKGNAEEDLAYYVHEVDKYEQAHESFTTAVGKAEESRRTSFTALLCRPRCQLRQIEGEPPADLQREVANLQQEVLKDLDVVTMKGTPAEQAEAYYWQGRAYSRLARQAEQEKSKESAQQYWGNADTALGQAVTIAQKAVPLDWAQYQWEWMNAAYDTRVWSDLKSRAKTLRDEAAKPGGLLVPTVVEYKAIVADFEADLRDRRTAALPAVRNGLDAALERFPQTDPPDPLRLSFRIRLLVQRCVWLITYSESLPDQALADATAAVSLADSLPETSTTQREELQGLARGTRAVYYDRKFIAFDRDPQNKDLDPEKKTKLKLELAIKAKEESGAALKHYAAFRRLCRTNRNQELAETVEYRWILGMGNRDLHKLYPDKFSPRERANMAKDAQEALLPLRGKLPTNKNNDLESALKYFSQPATPSSK